MVLTDKDILPFELSKFSPKALDFIKNSTESINIAEGAVRSGKTISVIYRFYLSLLDGIGMNHAIAGRTVDTCNASVVIPFLRILKSKKIPFEYLRGNREITIFFKEFTKTVYIFGADKIGSQNKIAGLTFTIYSYR